jgi:hypothetical protein
VETYKLGNCAVKNTQIRKIVEASVDRKASLIRQHVLLLLAKFGYPGSPRA